MSSQVYKTKGEKGLFDEQYQIIDRLSFKKFLGLQSGDKVPDEKTVWAFRENLTNSGVVELLFSQFIQYLDDKNLIFNEGKLIDASFTVAPRQRNTRDENEKIKKGEGNDLWNDQPNKKRHKDIDAKSVGIVRATGIIGLINLTYNLFRFEQVQRLNLCKV